MADAIQLRAFGAPGDLGWVIQRHGLLYAREHGWDTDFETLVGRIAVEFAERHDPGVERGWIAELGGRPVGCVFCVRADEETARLRLLLVDPGARGHGVGRRLVAECLAFARAAGYRRIVLWTNDVLVSARRIYEAEGFVLDAEERHRSFGHDLVGQSFSLAL
jgi:GNAT superfamily N-acetyltransferase